MVKPNTSERVKPLLLVARQELEYETPKAPIPKALLPIKMVLGKNPYANDQATSYISREYDDFEIFCDEYIEIFNELMRPRRTTQCFDVLPKIFNNAYPFKRRGVLSTLGVIKPKNGKGHARVMTKNFNSKNWRTNPLQGGGVDVEQVPHLGLLSLVRIMS